MSSNFASLSLGGNINGMRRPYSSYLIGSKKDHYLNEPILEVSKDHTVPEEDPVGQIQPNGSA